MTLELSQAELTVVGVAYVVAKAVEWGFEYATKAYETEYEEEGPDDDDGEPLPKPVLAPVRAVGES